MQIKFKHCVLPGEFVVVVVEVVVVVVGVTVVVVTVVVLVVVVVGLVVVVVVVVVPAVLIVGVNSLVRLSQPKCIHANDAEKKQTTQISHKTT